MSSVVLEPALSDPPVAQGSVPDGTPARARRIWLAVLAGGLLWSLWGAGVGRRALINPGGWTIARRFAVAAWHPSLTGDVLAQLWPATLVTIAYAVLGAALSLVLGLVGGILVSQTWWRSRRRKPRRLPVAWWGSRGLLAIPRGLHEAVWGLALINILGRDPLVGVLAIGVPYGAITAKVFADLLDDAAGPHYRSLLASGAGRLRGYAYGLLPVAADDMISYGFYRFDCAIRSAVILGIVGAGGLGLLLEESFQSLAYGQMWTCIYALVLVCGLADLLCHRLRRRLGGPQALTCRKPDPAIPPGGRPPRDRRLVLAAGAGAVLTGWSAVYLRLHAATLWSHRSRVQAAYVFGHAWPPRLGGATLRTLVTLSAQTMQMSVLAIAVAMVAAFVFAPLAARLPRAGQGGARRAASAASRGMLLLGRAVPAPVWALVILFVVLPGILPGALALGVYNAGVLGRLMGEVVENLERAPVRALDTLGADRLQSFGYAVLPRAASRYLTYGLYRWEVVVRETIVVGLVGAGGLGYLLARQVAGFDWHGGLATVIAMMVLTLIVDVLSSGARSAFR